MQFEEKQIIKEEIDRLRCEIAAAAFLFELLKYRLWFKGGFDPNQPRVPAGVPEGGQWTDADGPYGRPLLDLREFEGPSGHAIARHVGKSPEALKRRIIDSQRRVGMTTIFLPAVSSFPSLEAANKLVRSTLADPRNKPIVDAVAAGDISSRKVLEKTFASKTGIQAYVPRANMPPRITFRRRIKPLKPRVRDTYSVRVVIVHDPAQRCGFRIITAFPIGEQDD